jgi:hypothetical protein
MPPVTRIVRVVDLCGCSRQSCLDTAYGSIRQHTSAYVDLCGCRQSCLDTAYVSIRQHTSAYVSIRRLVRMPAKLLAIAFCVSICTLGVLGGSKVPRVVSRADFVRVERDESPASECGGELSSELTKPLATELTKPF